MKNSIAVSRVRGFLSLVLCASLLLGCSQSGEGLTNSLYWEADNSSLILKKYPGEKKDLSDGGILEFPQPPITEIRVHIDGTGTLIKDNIPLQEAELISYAQGLSRNTGWHSILLWAKHDEQSKYAEHLEETIEEISEDIDVFFVIFMDVK